RRGPSLIAAAMNPEHDRQLLAVVGLRRRKNIQVKAVLAGAGILKDHVRVNASLHAAMPVARGVAYAIPALCGLRRTPAQIAYRRRRERNSKKRPHLPRVDILPANLALFCTC